MKTTAFPPIPVDTRKAAYAVFGRSNFYLTVGDQANQLFDVLLLENLSNQVQKSLQTTGMLYLITIFQFIETLPDFLAADALRKRVDWKYALHLPLNFPGLDAAAFCQFRQWLLAEPAARQNFEALLSHLSLEITLFCDQRSIQEADQVVVDVCRFSRLAKIWETLNQAMEALATRDPNWLLGAARPHWYERYGAHHRTLELRIDRQKAVALAQSIGADGKYLLEITSKACNPELAETTEILVLREVWREQFEEVDGKLVWRKTACADCSFTGIISNINHSGSRTQ